MVSSIYNHRLFRVVIFFLIIVGFSSLVFHFHLQLDPVQSVYLTIVTLTTVGYGDITPLSRAREIGANQHVAQIYTIVLILLGMGILLYGVTEFTEYVVTGQYVKDRRRAHMDRQINRITEHTIICGGNELSIHIMAELSATARPFVLVEEDEKKLEWLAERDPKLLFVQGDSMNEEFLLAAGLLRASGVILAFPDEKDNLMIALTVRSCFSVLSKTTPRIVSRAIHKDSVVPQLRAAGVTDIVATNFIGGRRMATEMIRPSVTGFLDHMLGDSEQMARVEEIVIKQDSKALGHTLRSITSTRGNSVSVLALHRKGKFIFHPDLDTIVQKEDVLVVLGIMRSILKVRETVKQHV